MKSQHTLLLSGAVGGILAAVGTTVAQEAERTTLEEVVVTAQKRTQTLQDVPVAVSAFTDAMRDVLGIQSIQDLTDFTPGLAQSTTQDRISLRGIGRLTNNYGSDPGVATYSDGVYTSSTTDAGKPQIFIDRVEILRGPQGTLYGRNSIGGAINVISKRPTDTFESEARVRAGSYELLEYGASVSGPITDWLRYRLVGSNGGQNEGFFENVNDGTSEGNVNDDTWAEAQLEFNAGDSVDGWFKYAWQQWDQARRTGITITPFDIAPIYAGGLAPNALFNGGPVSATNPTVLAANPPYAAQRAAINDHRKYNTDTPFRARLTDTQTFTLELVGHLEWADLKYVGGYQAHTYKQTADFGDHDRVSFQTTAGPTTFTIFTQTEGIYFEDQEYHTNELNLISTGEGRLQWIVGLYQFHEDVLSYTSLRSPLQMELETPRISAPSAANPNPAAGPLNPQREYQRAGVHLVNNSYAAFGQIDYSLADAWQLTLGARYTQDEKVGEEFRRRVLYGQTVGSGAAIAGIPFAYYSEVDNRRLLGTDDLAPGEQGTWNALTGTAGIQWMPSSDTLAFAKYTRGYKSGGFNGGNFAADPYTDPEHINAYEIGLKQELFESVVTNFSVFYYEYLDLQVPLQVFDPATSLNTAQFFNIGKSEVLGAELESIWQITDALQWRLVYAYTDSETKDKDLCVIDNSDRQATSAQANPCGPLAGTGLAAIQAQFLAGNRLQALPEHKIATNVNYTWTFPIGSLTASVTWNYRDEVFSSVFTRDHERAPSYDESDFRLLWNGANDRYKVIGYVQNAFDDEGYERAGSGQSAWGVQTRTLNLTSPRTYGIELQFRFGS